MTRIYDTTQISRRKVLAGLGTIGLASAGAGLGTTAFFSDRESVRAALEAGRVDLLLDYRATYVPWNRNAETFENIGRIPGSDLDGDGGDDVYVLDQLPDLTNDGEPLSYEAWGSTVRTSLVHNLACSGDLADQVGFELVDGSERQLFELDDIKPKDEGEITISLHLCDNPVYLWMRTSVPVDEDGTLTEPEIDAGDPDGLTNGQPDFGLVDTAGGDGELADYIWVRVWYDADCDNVYDDGSDDDANTDDDDGVEDVFYEGSLAGFLAMGGGGLALDADRNSEVDAVDCFDPGAHCVALSWYLPCADVQDVDFSGTSRGFTQLPSDVPGMTTLADELDAKGLPHDLEGINVVQTDRLAFGLEFAAIQCRHNMLNANPFGEPGTFSVSFASGGTNCITPIEDAQSVVDFYDFSNPTSGLNLAESDTSLLFLYRDTTSGDLSLVMLHDANDDGSGGAATFEFAGTDGLSWVVQDDSGSSADDYVTDGSGNISRADWKWANAYTDGGAIGGLGGSFAVTISPFFNDAANLTPFSPGEITTWKIIGGNGEVFTPGLGEPVTIASGGC